MPASQRLTRSFFDRPTLQVAHELLGQRLVRIDPDHGRLAGLITETEAYIGTQDLGCHARAGRTARNASMWGAPGHAYVYFTYGVHWMLNLVTEQAGFPAAVLLRGLWPTEGVEIMRTRRAGRPLAQVADGPAKLCQALGIDRTLDGHDVCSAGARLFLEPASPIPEQHVTRGARVGLNKVPEPWKSKPWRFQVYAEFLQTFVKEANG